MDNQPKLHYEIQAMNDINAEKTVMKYYWVPRDEVVYLQAVIDAYEGLARIRTERHQDNRSLILCMVPEARQSELIDVMHHLSREVIGEIVSV